MYVIGEHIELTHGPRGVLHRNKHSNRPGIIKGYLGLNFKYDRR